MIAALIITVFTLSFLLLRIITNKRFKMHYSKDKLDKGYYYRSLLAGSMIFTLLVSLIAKALL